MSLYEAFTKNDKLLDRVLELDRKLGADEISPAKARSHAALLTVYGKTVANKIAAARLAGKPE